MKNYKELIEAQLKTMEDIHTKAQNEARDFTSDEQKTFDECEEKIKAYEKAIKREEALAARKSKLTDMKVAKKQEDKEVVTDLPVNKDTKVTGGHNRAEDKPWNHFGEEMFAIIQASDAFGEIEMDPRLIKQRSGKQLKNATGASVTVGSDGGYTVSTQFNTKVMDSVYESADLLDKIDMMPIGKGKNGTALPTLKETSRADGSRYGGIQAHWAGEGGTASASKPEFNQLEIKLSKLLSFIYVTEELMQDSEVLGAWIMKHMPQEIAFVADNAIIDGDGNGKPLGILNGGGLVSVAKETSQVAATIMFDNVRKMWARMPARKRKTAVWLVNQELESELMSMSVLIKNVAGTENVGGVPVYMPANGVTGLPYGTLFGRPVIPCEQCKALGTVGDILLVDPKDYIGIEKGKITSDSSIHVQFLYDEQLLRFRYRFNGAPYTQNKVASFAKSTYYMSPYVALATRA